MRQKIMIILSNKARVRQQIISRVRRMDKKKNLKQRIIIVGQKSHPAWFLIPETLLKYNLNSKMVEKMANYVKARKGVFETAQHLSVIFRFIKLISY